MVFALMTMIVRTREPVFFITVAPYGNEFHVLKENENSSTNDWDEEMMKKK